MLYEITRPVSYPCPFVMRDAPRIDDDFIEDLREFICLRLDRVEPYKRSMEYRLQQEKASRLYDGLMAMLPEDGWSMLLEYGESIGTAHYLEVAMLAERAFFDGVRLVLRAMGAGGEDQL